MSFLKAIKNGLNNYLLQKKLNGTLDKDAIKKDKKLIFTILSEELGNKKVPKEVVWKSKEHLKDIFIEWNRVTDYVNKLALISQRKGLPFREEGIKALKESFFMTDMKLKEILNSPYSFTALEQYAISPLNTKYFLIRSEIYEMIKEENEDITKAFYESMANNVGKIDYNDGAFLFKGKDDALGIEVDIEIPKEIVQDVLIEAVKRNDNELIKKFKETFIKAIDNSMLEKLNLTENKEALLRTILSLDKQSIEQVDISINKEESKQLISDIEKYIKNINANPAAIGREQILRQQMSNLLAIAEEIIISNLKELYKIPSSDKMLLDKFEAMKEENTKILRKVKNVLEKTGGGEYIKPAFNELINNISSYVDVEKLNKPGKTVNKSKKMEITI